MSGAESMFGVVGRGGGGGGGGGRYADAYEGSLAQGSAMSK